MLSEDKELDEPDERLDDELQLASAVEVEVEEDTDALDTDIEDTDFEEDDEFELDELLALAVDEVDVVDDVLDEALVIVEVVALETVEVEVDVDDDPLVADEDEVTVPDEVDEVDCVEADEGEDDDTEVEDELEWLASAVDEDEVDELEYSSATASHNMMPFWGIGCGLGGVASVAEPSQIVQGPQPSVPWSLS